MNIGFKHRITLGLLCIAVNVNGFADENVTFGDAEDVVMQRVLQEISGKELPLPEQGVEQLRKDIRDYEDSKKVQIINPNWTEQVAAFDPGQPYNPIEIRISDTFPTTLIISDKYGKPWPIAAKVVTEANMCAVQVGGSCANEGGGQAAGGEGGDSRFAHQLILKAKIARGRTPLTLWLKDMDAPIVIPVVFDRENFFSKMTLQINSALSPENESRSVALRTVVGSSFNKQALLNCAAGLSPLARSERLKGDLPGVMAWNDGDNVYIRTKHILHYPPIQQQDYSINDYVCYLTSEAPAYRLLTKTGEIVRLRLEK